MFIDREIQRRTESGLQNLLKCLESLDFVLLDLSYLALQHSILLFNICFPF